jgi:hypothetical protein
VQSALRLTNEVHDQNAKLNGQLLDDNNAAPLVLFRNLGQVNRHLAGRDADADAIEDASSDELAHAVGRDLHCGAQQPPQAGKGNAVASAELVGYGTSHQGSQDRSSCQGRPDGALDDAVRIVEVPDVLICADNGCHARDVEAEAGIRLANYTSQGGQPGLVNVQHAANCSHTRQEISIIDLW